MWCLNSIPGIGHVKAVVHYVSGDFESGHQAMLEATRSTLVIGGGVVGAVGGPALAAAGAVAAGHMVDTCTTLATGKPQGLYQGVDNIITDIQSGRNPTGSVLSTAVMVGADAVGGMAGGSLLSGAGKSVGTSVGKSVAKDAAIKVLEKQALSVAVNAPVVRTLAQDKLNQPQDRNSSSSTGSTGGTSNRTAAGKTTSNSAKSSQTSASGNQSPNNNPNNNNNNNNNNKKGNKKEEECIELLLEIFGVSSLDDILMAGRNIFGGLNREQRNTLNRAIRRVIKDGNDLTAVINLIERFFSTLQKTEISYGVFLSLLEFIREYISEQIGENLRQYHANPENFSDLINLSPTQRQQRFRETVVNCLLEIQDFNQMVTLFRNLRTSIENLPTIQPSFRDVICAVYHYYKHKSFNDCELELTVPEYFNIIEYMLRKLEEKPEYSRFESERRLQIVFERVDSRFRRRIVLVLKRHQDKVILASCYIADRVHDADEVGDEYIDGKKI